MTARFAVLIDPGPAAARAADRVSAYLGSVGDCAPVLQRVGNGYLWQAQMTDRRGDIARHGPLTLVGDLGLTDLDQLRATLGASGSTSGPDLILRAWDRWADGAAAYLNGSFAFAIHDARTQDVTVVRDRMGVSPIMHATDDNRTVVASDIPTVLAALDARPAPDREWIAGFLTGYALLDTDTAWAGVRRLPAGHVLKLTRDGQMTTRTWYRLTDTPASPRLPPTEALRAALAHATAEACRDQPTATMLSGGLDSSSLALLSVGDGQTEQARPALSLRYRDPALDEGDYIDAVLTQAHGRLKPVSLRGEDADADIFSVDEMLDWHGQPIFAPGLTRNLHLYDATRAAGCMAVLDGHGGDEIIGGNFRDITLTASGSGWPRAIAQTFAHARFGGTPVINDLADLLSISGRVGFGRLGRGLQTLRGEKQTRWSNPLDPDLTRDLRMIERLGDLQRPDVGDADIPEGTRLHAATITGPHAVRALETLAQASRSRNVAVHYPFFDHRVAELCIWQAPSTKIARGQPRALLRQAMHGILPEKVRQRRDKVNFIGSFWAALRRDAKGMVQELLENPSALQGWADMDLLQADGNRLRRSDEPDPDTAFRLWRALWLARWLIKLSAVRPAPAPAVRHHLRIG